MAASDHLNAEQFMSVFHRTTPGNAGRILKEQRFHPDPGTPGSVYASDKAHPPEGSPTWEYGESAVEIRVPRSAVHVEDDFGDERHVRVDEPQTRGRVVRAWSDLA